MPRSSLNTSRAIPWTWKSCGRGGIGPKDEIGCATMPDP